MSRKNYDPSEFSTPVAPSFEYLPWDTYGDEFCGTFVRKTTDWEGKPCVLMVEEGTEQEFYLGGLDIMQRMIHAKPGFRYLIRRGEKKPTGDPKRTFRPYEILEPAGQKTPEPTSAERQAVRDELNAVQEDTFPG